MTPTPRRSSSSRTVALVTVAMVLASCVPCTGILAAVAIPAFIGYVRRSKTVEARTNVARIAGAVSERYAEDGVLPPACPRTPAVVGAQRYAWPVPGDPAWEGLGFHPDPVYYAYSYEPSTDGTGFVVAAAGDLDGDGHESRFEIRGHVDPTSRDVVLDPLEVVDELE